MCFTDITQAVYDALLADAHFENVTVLKAYPFAVTPTKLTQPVVTVSPATLKGETAGLGEAQVFGDFAVDADAFLPFADGSPALSALTEHILTAVLPLQPTAVAVSPVKTESGLFCYRITCTFTFNGVFDNGGNNHDNP